MSLESCIGSLQDEQADLGYQVLIELSDLTSSELGIFARAWFKLSVPRRVAVVERMVELGEENPELDFFSIYKVCLKDSDDKVRRTAVHGLWEFEDRSLIQSLVDLLLYDSSGEVRAEAAMGLGKFASLAEDGKVLSKDGDLVRESLMRTLRKDGEWLEVTRRALESAAPFNTPEIYKHIHRAYDSDDTDLKCSSIYAMGRTGESQWLPLIFRELTNPSPPIRYEAANACGQLDDEEAAPHLLPLLHDDDLQVQLAAINALGEIGGQIAMRALFVCIEGEDAVLEDAARTALENLKAMEEPLGFNYGF